MGVLRFVKRLYLRFCKPHWNLLSEIDSHKWESKMEILKGLSSNRGS